MLVRAGSARHQEPLVPGGHERSTSANENRRSQVLHRLDLGRRSSPALGSNPSVSIGLIVLAGAVSSLPSARLAGWVEVKLPQAPLGLDAMSWWAYPGVGDGSSDSGGPPRVPRQGGHIQANDVLRAVAAILPWPWQPGFKGLL
jgi:hypothetical protein